MWKLLLACFFAFLLRIVAASPVDYGDDEEVPATYYGVPVRKPDSGSSSAVRASEHAPIGAISPPSASYVRNPKLPSAHFDRYGGHEVRDHDDDARVHVELVRASSSRSPPTPSPLARGANFRQQTRDWVQPRTTPRTYGIGLHSRFSHPPHTSSPTPPPPLGQLTPVHDLSDDEGDPALNAKGADPSEQHSDSYARPATSRTAKSQSNAASRGLSSSSSAADIDDARRPRISRSVPWSVLKPAHHSDRPIYVVYAASQHMWVALSTSIRSLFTSASKSTQRRLRVYVLVEDVELKEFAAYTRCLFDTNVLERIMPIRYTSASIRLAAMTEHIDKESGDNELDTRERIAMWSVFYAPHILPHLADALWLDADTLVIGDVADVWDALVAPSDDSNDDGEADAKAKEEHERKTKEGVIDETALVHAVPFMHSTHAQLGINVTHPRIVRQSHLTLSGGKGAKKITHDNAPFRTGVMLLHMSRWRAANVSGSAEAWVEKRMRFHTLFRIHPAAVLQLSVGNRYARLDKSWNVPYTVVDTRKEDDLLATHIVHFRGDLKPWMRLDELPHRLSESKAGAFVAAQQLWLKFKPHWRASRAKICKEKPAFLLMESTAAAASKADDDVQEAKSGKKATKTTTTTTKKKKKSSSSHH